MMTYVCETCVRFRIQVMQACKSHISMWKRYLEAPCYTRAVSAIDKSFPGSCMISMQQARSSTSQWCAMAADATCKVFRKDLDELVDMMKHSEVITPPCMCCGSTANNRTDRCHLMSHSSAAGRQRVAATPVTVPDNRLPVLYIPPASVYTPSSYSLHRLYIMVYDER